MAALTMFSFECPVLEAVVKLNVQHVLNHELSWKTKSAITVLRYLIPFQHQFLRIGTTVLMFHLSMIQARVTHTNKDVWHRLK